MRVSEEFPDIAPTLIAAVTTAVWKRNARRERSGEIRFTCPCGEAHRNGDATPSARWNEHRAVWRCDVCTAGGGVKDLAERLQVTVQATATATTYEIKNRDGVVVALHRRVDRPDGTKRCYWSRPGGEAGLGDLPLEALPLYGSERLATAAPGARIVITEGEKPSASLIRHGILSCATVTGAGTIPTDAVLQVLTGLEVILWSDADAVGRVHMARIAARLKALSIGCRVLDPWPQEKDTGRDAADFVGTDAELEVLLATAAEPKETTSTAVGVLLADVVAEQVQWLWPRRLPLGKLVILEGRPDEGKTTVAVDLAARASTGAPMPFETDGRAPTGVVLLSAEDGLADTIRPRLEAAGADLTRIVSAKLDELPTLDEAGLAFIHALVERIQATLIILDPLMAFVPDAVDTYKDHHARRLLRKLALLAEETGATVLVLRHVRKGAALNAKDAGGGSTGFTAAARVVLLAAGDPNDETTKVLARVKGNLAPPFPSLGYRLVGAGLTVTGLTVTGLTVKVEWLGETTHTAEQLLEQPATTEEASELDEAKAAVLDLVADGPVAADQAIRELKRRGIAERTWKRAKASLGVRSRKESFTGAWSWYLPEEGHPLEPGHTRTGPASAPPPAAEPEPEECRASEPGPISGRGTLRDAPAEEPLKQAEECHPPEECHASEPLPAGTVAPEAPGPPTEGDQTPPKRRRRVAL